MRDVSNLDWNKGEETLRHLTSMADLLISHLSRKDDCCLVYELGDDALLGIASLMYEKAWELHALLFQRRDEGEAVKEDRASELRSTEFAAQISKLVKDRPDVSSKLQRLMLLLAANDPSTTALFEQYTAGQVSKDDLWDQLGQEPPLQ